MFLVAASDVSTATTEYCAVVEPGMVVVACVYVELLSKLYSYPVSSVKALLISNV
jgi:hypothetical protein